MPRLSRASRQSYNSTPIATLEHDAIAVALQDALGGRVLLIRPIGEGGMGRVYLGRDPQLKRFVAVKVLLQSLGADEEAHARFQREAQAIAAVSHAARQGRTNRCPTTSGADDANRLALFRLRHDKQPPQG